jgi:carbon-monoxide dehydrogenase large subunit
VLVDRIARQLKIDPAELRRRNLIRPDQMPFISPTGANYDSGDYAGCLDAALARLDYEKLRREQKEARAQGRYLGVGLSCYVEHAGYSADNSTLGRSTGRRFGAYESVTVRMDATGHATVTTGIPHFGQGVETAFSQICATSLGVLPDDVIVDAGDTRGSPQSVGAFGSRGTLSGGGAISKAAAIVKAKILRLAAHHAQLPLESLEIAEAVVRSAEDPAFALPVSDIAESAIVGIGLPQGEEPGLEATAYWSQPAPSWGYGSVAAVVDVDVKTGEFKLLRFIVAHDCGTRLNPKLVEGQVAGGIVQGLGAALMEGLVYDRDSGQLVNGSLVDYMVPTAADLPAFELEHTESPSPYTPFGMKGVGESGVIGAAAAVSNAIADALSPFGVEINAIPITPESVWRALRRAGH